MVDMMPQYMGYDRAIVVFSPDGRLFQVEYAREAVKRGMTSLGIRFENGILLMATKSVTQLLAESSSDKVAQIDDHIGIVSSGIVADARILIDKLRVKSQMHKLTYDEPIDVNGSVRYLADAAQLYTQYAGLRPYGVAFLIGGMDNDVPKLFETDPSGSMNEWKAKALGRGAEAVEKHFESKFKDGLTRDEALKLAFEALGKGEKKVDADGLEIAFIDKEGFKKLPKDEVKKLVKKFE